MNNPGGGGGGTYSGYILVGCALAHQKGCLRCGFSSKKGGTYTLMRAPIYFQSALPVRAFGPNLEVAWVPKCIKDEHRKVS